MTPRRLPLHWVAPLTAGFAALQAVAASAQFNHARTTIATYQVYEATTDRLLYTSREWEEAPEPANGVTAVTEVTFPDGRVLVDHMRFTRDAPPNCVSWRRSVRTESGEIMGSQYGRCDPEAYPFVGRPFQL